MKKNIFTRTIALATALTLGLSTFAFADTTASVGGSSPAITVSTATTVANPTYSFLATTVVDLKIDPFTRSPLVSGSALNTAAPIMIINKSDVNVRVGVTATVNKVTNVFNKHYDAVNQNSLTNKNKEFAMRLVPFGPDATLTATGAFTSTGGVTFVTEDAGQVAVVGDTPSTTANPKVRPAELVFALAKATYSTGATPAFTGIAAGKTGYAGVGIDGKVNPIAAWANGDITLVLKYDVTGMSDTAFAGKQLLGTAGNASATVISSTDADNLPLLPARVTGPAGTVSASATGSGAAKLVSFNVDYGKKGATKAVSYVLYGPGGFTRGVTTPSILPTVTTAVPDTDANGIYHLKALATDTTGQVVFDAEKLVKVKWPKGVYDLKVSFDNGDYTDSLRFEIKD